MISRSVRLWRIAAPWQLALAQQRCSSIACTCRNCFGAADRLTRRGYASSNDRRFTSEEMEALIRNPSMSIPRDRSKTSQPRNKRRQPSRRRTTSSRAKLASDRLLTSEEMAMLITGKPKPKQSASKSSLPVKDSAAQDATVETAVKDEEQQMSTAATSSEIPESNAAEHAAMPDIETYEPNEAELTEMLEAAHATSSDGQQNTGSSSRAELEIVDAAEVSSRRNGVAHDEYDTLASEDDIVFETSPAETKPKSRPFEHELLTHQYLGVAALGQPVEALILKDPNRMKRSRKVIPVLENNAADAEAPIELKWTDYVNSPGEDAKKSPLEAWDNIDEMRPVDATIIPEYEYHRLVTALVDGFTAVQLSSYITVTHVEFKGKAEEAARYPWIEKQTPWAAAYEIELEDTKPKYLLSAAILDKVWKLEVREQVESLGRALLWVHPTTFQLLTEHGRHALESIQRDILNPGNNERLAAKSEESRIGIYASKSTIAPVMARLDDLAQSITSSQLAAESIDKENLQQPVLDNLARITNTIIEKDSSGKLLTVHWIADKDRPKPSNTDQDASMVPEGPADIVWRLLVAAQNTHNTESDPAPQALTHTARGKLKGAAYIDYYREKKSMAWRDKLRSWSRYIGSVALPSEKKQLSLRLAKRVQLGQLSSPAALEVDNVSEVTAATFGHILHPADATAKGAKGTKGITSDKARRILSPVIPHPAALTSLSTNDEPIAQSTAIILNFSPDITQLRGQDGSVTLSRLPQVRLTLPVDETADLSNFNFPPNSTLNAIAAQRVQDLLLPAESVDVRLTQQQLLPLDADQPSLRRFLSASEFNLLEGRLRTPSRVAFSLANEEAEVPYLFMGLEVHQAVETALYGHTIRYASIEAGQHGGQRQELSLHRGGGGGAAETADDGFLQLVEDVATGNVFSWNDGHGLMQERSNEQFTMDMLEDGKLEEQLLEVDAREELLVDEKEDEVPVIAADESVTSEETCAAEEDEARQQQDDEEPSESKDGDRNRVASNQQETSSEAGDTPPMAVAEERASTDASSRDTQ